jgi:hypothetical protein
VTSDEHTTSPSPVAGTTTGITRVEFTYCEALAAELRQSQELTPAFGVGSLRSSITRVAEQALEADDPETREIAAELLHAVRLIRS